MYVARPVGHLSRAIFHRLDLFKTVSIVASLSGQNTCNLSQVQIHDAAQYTYNKKAKHLVSFLSRAKEALFCILKSAPKRGASEKEGCFVPLYIL